MKGFPEDTKVRIKNYGGAYSSHVDKKLNGVIGKVTEWESMSGFYVDVALPTPHNGLDSVLCLPEELEVIEE